MPLISTSQRYPQGGRCQRACIHSTSSSAFVVMRMERHCEYGTDINPRCSPGGCGSSATSACSDTNHAWSKRSTRHGSSKCRSVGYLGCNRPRTYARCQCLAQTATYLRWAKLSATNGDTRLVSKSSHHNISRQTKKHLCFTFVHLCINDCPHDDGLVFPSPTTISRAHYYRRPHHGAPIRRTRQVRSSRGTTGSIRLGLHGTQLMDEFLHVSTG